MADVRRSAAETTDDERGAIALLVLVGGGVAMLIALVLVVSIADLVVSRGQAQLAADAAALAAMAEQVAVPLPPRGVQTRGSSTPDRAVADLLARANGGVLVECCGRVPARREVTVAVVPRSVILRTVVRRIHARAAAALTAEGMPGALDASGLGSGAVGGHGVGGALSGQAAGARVWPVDGPVSSGFGLRVHPVTGGRRLHAGLDVAVPSGTPIRAAAAGRVVHTGPMGGYGLTVDLAHGGGAVTRYAHQTRVLVAPGQAVAAGQVIGLVGASGTATGPHLHFEVRLGGHPVDPLGWLPQPPR